MLETDVSHSSATVFRCMPTSSIRRATLAAEASTGLPRAMTRASLTQNTPEMEPRVDPCLIRGGENYKYIVAPIPLFKKWGYGEGSDFTPSASYMYYGN